MTDAISSISSSAASISSSSTSSKVLTDATKKKLEALGIDTSGITTEAEGLQKLQEAQSAQATAKAQKAAQSGSNPMQTMEDNVKSLAAKTGVVVGSNDKIDDIFDKISEKISELQSSAGTDESKKAEVSGFASEYSTLYSEYTQATATQNMTGATALGNYNKAALGLS